MEPNDKVTALRRVLEPEAVAVVGASERSFYGRMAVQNLRSHGFTGRIVPVNPRVTEVQGLACFPSLDDAPDVDLVISAVPREHLVEVVEAAGRSGAAGVVVLTSGLAETGDPHWAAVEAKAIAAAQAAGMVLIGPNCLGLVGTRKGVYALGAPMPWSLGAGSTALIMQSGGLLCASLAALAAYGVGISHAASIGNGASVGVADWLRTCLTLAEVTQVGMLLEAVPPWEQLAPAVRALRARGAAVYALKTGRSSAGARAAATHTGALVGSHGVAAGLLRQLGVRECVTMSGLTTALALEDRFGAAKGSNLAVLTASGGAASLIADACADRGIELRAFSPATEDRLRGSVGILEPTNPLDTGGQALSKPEEFAEAVRSVAADPTVGALLYVPTLGLPDERLPEHRQLLESVRAASAGSGKAVIVTQLTYSDPVSAVIDEYRQVRSVLLAPSLDSALDGVGPWLAGAAHDPPAAADEMLAAATARGAALVDSTVDEVHVKQMLSRRGVAVPRAVTYRPGDTPKAMPFRSAVLKAVSSDVVHKSRHGLVMLGLSTPEQLRTAEAQIMDAAGAAGVSVDTLLLEEMAPSGTDVFASVSAEPVGTIVTLGRGGTDVEERRDVSFLGWPATDAELAAVVHGLDLPDAGSGNQLCELIKQLVRAYDDEGLALLECNPVRIGGAGPTALDAVAVMAMARGHEGTRR